MFIREIYPTDLQVGDQVHLKREPTKTGKVILVEDNLLSVMVQWDDCPDALDFQWSNKLIKCC